MIVGAFYFIGVKKKGKTRVDIGGKNPNPLSDTTMSNAKQRAAHSIGAELAHLFYLSFTCNFRLLHSYLYSSPLLTFFHTQYKLHHHHSYPNLKTFAAFHFHF